MPELAISVSKFEHIPLLERERSDECNYWQRVLVDEEHHQELSGQEVPSCCYLHPSTPPCQASLRLFRLHRAGCHWQHHRSFLSIRKTSWLERFSEDLCIPGSHRLSLFLCAFHAAQYCPASIRLVSRPP